MTSRPLTSAEREIARSVFGDALDLAPVRVHHQLWWPFQPKGVVMAPDGHIWCHPRGNTYRECFASSGLAAQGLLVHELVHVWQRQCGIFLPVARHPFCRYSYTIKPGWPLRRYGIEQQAEIVRHTFLLRQGASVPGAPSLQTLESILPF